MAYNGAVSNDHKIPLSERLLMTLKRTLVFAAAVMFAAGPSLSNEVDKNSTKTAEQQSGWNDSKLQQPATESIDLNAYNAIREEGLQHSHVMDFAGGLADGIGPRLIGSPNMAKANAWTLAQLTKMGCVNAHLEDWGEFGMGWQQLNTWVRMTEPDTAIFLAQATPWSPSTSCPITAQAISVVINDESDIAKYKGKLSGKIVLLGPMRDVPVPDKPFFERYTDKDLKDLESLPVTESKPNAESPLDRYLKRVKLRNTIYSFLTEEKVAGVILPSRDGEHGGGTGIIFDDTSATPYRKDTALAFPAVVTQIENYGR